MAPKAIDNATDDDALLSLRGALDAGSARVLGLKAQSLLATGHTHQVVDLAEVDVDGPRTAGRRRCGRIPT